MNIAVRVLRFVMIALASASVTAIMQSCDSGGCTDNQNSLPLAVFYASSTGEPVTLTGLDVGGVGAVNDSLIYKSYQSLSEVYLPLRSNATTTAYYFHYTQEGLEDESLNDTISFDYTSSPYFASEDCGAVLYYHVRSYSYTTHLIDSVVMVDSLITNIDAQRIRIYFRTQDN